MNSDFPAMYSTLSSDSLLELAIRDYNNIGLAECKLLARGLNDSYLLTTINHERYVLRVYRANWRTTSEISFELDSLIHLHEEGVSVSIPLPRKNKEYILSIKCIEGIRHLVLFTHAPGKVLTYENDEQCIQYGRAVAAVHAATAGFTSRHSRSVLDLDHLIHFPMKSIQSYLSGRVQDLEYIDALSKRLLTKLESLEMNRLEWGFCHGDLHGGNVNVSKDNIMTVYDFDCCGYGWRAYDTSIFRWSALLQDKEAERWNLFLKGYAEIRELKEADMKATALFIGVRHIWLMGLHAANVYQWGWPDDDYYERQMKFLRKWEAMYLE